MDPQLIKDNVEKLAQASAMLVQANDALIADNAALRSNFTKQAADLAAAREKISELQAMPKSAGAPALSEDAVQHVVAFLADRQLLADLSEDGLEKLASEISQDPNKMVWLLEHTIRQSVGAPAKGNGSAVKEPGIPKKARKDTPADEDFFDTPASGREHIVTIR